MDCDLAHLERGGPCRCMNGQPISRRGLDRVCASAWEQIASSKTVMTPTRLIDEWPLIALTTDATGSTTFSGQAMAVCGNRNADTLGSDPYCEWTWDGTSLVARTDRYGFFPLFYYQWDRGIMLSPSISVLLNSGAPSELNDAAIAVLVRRWMCVGEDTPFAHIRSLPAAGQLSWTPGNPLRVDGSFVFGQRTSPSRSAALDGYIDRFRHAIRRRPAHATSIVPLSGGRDSRHIFLELCASGQRPDVTVTVGRVGRQTTSNATIASALARRAGIRHETLRLPASRWRAQQETVREMHLSALETWWLRSFTAYLDELPARPVVYEGVAGDVLSSGLYKDERLRRLYDRGDFMAIADALLGAEQYFEQLLPLQFHARFRRELAMERLVTELAKHADAPNQLGSFFVYNRTRRVTALAPTSLMSPRATVWCPYLDADVWDYLSSLPPEFLEGHSGSVFHDEAIHRAYPEFADIPFGTKWRGQRAYDLRTIAEMLGAAVTNPPMMIRKSYLLPRLVRGLLDPTFTRSAAELTPVVSFFMQLEACSAPERGATVR